MALFKKKPEIEEELPKEYLAMKTIFDKEYDSDEYVERRKKMNEWLELYEAKLWKDGLDDNASRVQVNYIFSNIQALCPLLTDNKPIWHIRAEEPVFQNLANLYNKAGEYLWEAEEMSDLVYLVELDALLWPVALTKTYFDSETDKIVTELADPRNFVIAPGYEDVWKAPWCGEKLRKPMSWVKMKFPDEFEDVKPDNDTSSDSHEDKTDMQLENENVTIYYMWIRDNSVEDYIIQEANEEEGIKKEKGTRKKYPNGRIVIFTNTVVLSDEPSPFEHGFPPYVAWYDYRVPHSFWGMGEPQQIEYLHKEYNRQLQTAVQWARLTENPNYTIDSASGLDEDEVKDKFAEGGNMWVASHMNSNEPIKMIETGKMDRIHLDLLGILPQAIEEASRVTELSKGRAAKKERQSASEVSIMIESSYTGVRQKVRNLEFSLKRVNYLHTSLMIQNYTAPKYFSMKTGDEQGERVDFGLVGNSANVFRQTNKPEQLETDAGTKESEEDYGKRLSEDKIYQETERLIEEVFGDVDPIHFKFRIEIQTNSTLPMDKQSLANLYLRLAEVRSTPQSIIDDEAVMDALQIPDKEAILHRKELLRKEEMKAKMPPAAPTGGPKKVPMGGQTPPANLAGGM